MARTSWRRTGARSSGFDFTLAIQLACKLLKFPGVNTHLPVSETAAKRMRKKSASAKARKSRTASSKKNAATPQLAAAGSLTRTKALLLAALRVWELKHRVSE